MVQAQGFATLLTSSLLISEDFWVFLSFLSDRNKERLTRKRVVSERVVLAGVPLYRNFLPKVFPCSATLAEESHDF